MRRLGKTAMPQPILAMRPIRRQGSLLLPPRLLPLNTAYDLTLQHPRCVFQLLKQQYSRYTPEMVERITGIPKDQFIKAVDLFTSIRKDGDMKKGGDHHLRRRLDPAHLRHANHSHRGDDSASARQCRQRRRRRERPARPFEYSRRHGYGRALRQPARDISKCQFRPMPIWPPISNASRPLRRSPRRGIR